MTFLFRILARLPLVVLHALGFLLGWGAFLLARDYRRSLLQNAARAGVARRQALRSVAQAGQLLAELPRLWLGPMVAVRWDGEAHLVDALAAGTGVLALTPHLGSFEAVARAYAQRHGARGKPMTVLFRPARKAWLQELVAQARQRPGLASAPTTLAGVKQLLRVLQSGGCVGLLPDQVPGLGQGVWSPFFGAPAYTMTLAVRLAQQTRARLVLAWCERLSWGRGYVVHVRRMPELPPGLQPAVDALNQHMEALILEMPSQYLWSYARYKAPQAGASA